MIYYNVIQTFDNKNRKCIKVHKDHLELLAIVANKYHNLEYHEGISVNNPFLFHIDMDSDNEDLIKHIPTIIDSLEIITRIQNLKYIITGSDNFKSKFHLICPNLVCQNGNAYFQLMVALTNELPDGIIQDNRWKSFQVKPDKSEKFVNLRMICSNKYNDNKKCFERQKYIQYSNYEIKNIQDCFLTRYGLHTDTFDKALFDFEMYFHKEIISLEEVKYQPSLIELNNKENFCNIPTSILIKCFEMISDRASLSMDE